MLVCVLCLFKTEGNTGEGIFLFVFFLKKDSVFVQLVTILVNNWFLTCFVVCLCVFSIALAFHVVFLVLLLWFALQGHSSA